MEMKFFVKINEQNQIIRTYAGVMDDTQTQELINDGYIEITSDIDGFEYVGGDIPTLYIDGQVIIDEDKQQIDKRREELSLQYDSIYSQLSGTDYVACKIAEGAATTEEYQDILDQRAEWRTQINELKKEIDKLK